MDDISAGWTGYDTIHQVAIKPARNNLNQHPHSMLYAEYGSMIPSSFLSKTLASV